MRIPFLDEHFETNLDCACCSVAPDPVAWEFRVPVGRAGRWIPSGPREVWGPIDRQIWSVGEPRPCNA
jgi:hypothetical protein